MDEDEPPVLTLGERATLARWTRVLEEYACLWEQAVPAPLQDGDASPFPENDWGCERGERQRAAYRPPSAHCGPRMS
jgi:hypothetical protein